MNFFTVLIIITTWSFMKDIVESMKLHAAVKSRLQSPLEKSIFLRFSPFYVPWQWHGMKSFVSLEEKVMYLGRFEFESLGVDSDKDVALMTSEEMLEYIVEIGWKQLGLYKSLKPSNMVHPGDAQIAEPEHLWNPWEFFDVDVKKFDFHMTNDLMTRLWSPGLVKMTHEIFSFKKIERILPGKIDEITKSLDEKIRNISNDSAFKASGESDKKEVLKQLKSDFEYIRDLIDNDSEYGSVDKLLRGLDWMYKKVREGDMRQSLVEQMNESRKILNLMDSGNLKPINDFKIIASNLENAEENLNLAIGYLKKLREIGGLKQVLARSLEAENVSNKNERLRFLFRNDLFGYEDPVDLVGDTIKKHKVNFAQGIQLDKFECVSRSKNLNTVARYVGVVEVEHLFFEKLKRSRQWKNDYNGMLQRRTIKTTKTHYKDFVPFGVFEIEVSKEDRTSWTDVGVECSVEFDTGGYTVRINEPFKPLHIIGDFVNHFVLTGNECENEYEVNAEISDTNGESFEAIQLSQPAFNVYILDHLEGNRQFQLVSRLMKDFEGLGLTLNSRNAFPRRKLVIRNEKITYDAFISTLGLTKFSSRNGRLEGTMTVNPIVDAFCFETPQNVKETEPKSSVIFNVDIQKTYIPPNYDRYYDILVPNSDENMSCVILLQNKVCYLYENISLRNKEAAESAPEDLYAIDHTIVHRILEKEGFNCKKYVIWIGEIEMEMSSIRHALEQLNKLPETEIKKKKGQVHSNNGSNRPVLEKANIYRN